MESLTWLASINPWTAIGWLILAGMCAGLFGLAWVAMADGWRKTRESFRSRDRIVTG